MMTTCKRDLKYYQILECISLCSRKVVFALFFLQFLPYVICQEERGSSNGRIKFTSDSLIVVSLLMIFLLSMLAGCLFYIAPGREVETREGVEERQSSENSGLDKDMIESFTSFLYSEVKGLKIDEGGVECAICLSEFEDEEMLRMISPCNHAFHANCIDVWLSSWSTCPVCRLDLSPSLGKNLSCNNLSMDPERGCAQRGVLESLDRSLIDSVAWNEMGNRQTRSRSARLSSWRIKEIFFPRSHSTGHSKVQLGTNLERFTLQLPEEVQKQLVTLISKSHIALPRARSSPQGYRNSGFGSERSNFTLGEQKLQRSLSMSFSIPVSVPSSLGREDPVAPPTGWLGLMKVPFGETSQAKNREQSFKGLRP